MKPSTTRSLTPGLSYITGTTPSAMASSTARPKASFLLVTTRKSEADMILATSALGLLPSITTLSESPDLETS